MHGLDLPELSIFSLTVHSLIKNKTQLILSQVLSEPFEAVLAGICTLRYGVPAQQPQEEETAWLQIQNEHSWREESAG